jgi:Cu-processing system permease protein
MRMLYIAHDTHVLLKRSKIFLPMLLLLGGIGITALLLGQLSANEFRQILLDVSLAGLHVAGGAAAIFWGTKAMNDSKQEGSLEVQLASPVSRTEWLVGKYLGLASTLLILGILFAGIGAASLYAYRADSLTPNEFIAFAYLAMIWLVLAAAAILFSSFCNPAVATFSCLALWFTGGLSHYLTASGAKDGSIDAKGFLATGLRLWDLQRFNLSELLYTQNFPSSTELAWRAAYGLGLIAFLLTAACLIFNSRDIGR